MSPPRTLSPAATATPVRVIITGEYPPQPGGVSAYTRRVAEGLAAAGEQVHVLAPACGGPSTGDGVATVHRLPGTFGAHALQAMAQVLEALPERRRILVQWVPHAFGWRAMNLPLCAWLATRPEPLDVMFHEVAYPWRPSAKALVLASAHRVMAGLISLGADRAYTSTPAWEPLLRRVGLRGELQWLPVPSNLPERADPEAVARVRCRLSSGDVTRFVGHFGTHGEPIAPLVAHALPAVLRARGDAAALLVGRGSQACRDRLAAAHPALATRLAATGELTDEEAAAHLAACDVLVQPYPDGATTRRGSLMAGLALGRAIVTNDGPLTEPFWRGSAAVALARDPGAIAAIAAELLGDASRSSALGSHGAALYRERFALGRTIAALHATWATAPTPLSPRGGSLA